MMLWKNVFSSFSFGFGFKTLKLFFCFLSKIQHFFSFIYFHCTVIIHKYTPTNQQQLFCEINKFRFSSYLVRELYFFFTFDIWFFLFSFHNFSVFSPDRRFLVLIKAQTILIVESSYSWVFVVYLVWVFHKTNSRFLWNKCLQIYIKNFNFSISIYMLWFQFCS